MRRPEYEAARWLAQAQDDLRFAEWVLEEDRFFDKGCFIAQQAGEKALKALLYSGGARMVLGHSCAELLAKLILGFPELATLRDPATVLDRFYIPTRYPNGLPGGAPYESFRRSDLEQALAMARQIVQSVARRLAGKDVADPGEPNLP